jgi:sigma-B regulation protein RsbU (phosphoserine phosphatase)
MVLVETQLTANEVLRAFLHDEPFLFLGAAFITVGIVSAAFCILRRRFDTLLLCFAAFAFLYGQRLWMQSTLLHLTVTNSGFFGRLQAGIDPLVPIPAFLFFQAVGFLGRIGKILITASCLVFLGLGVAAFALGYLPQIHAINNLIVVAALLTMMVRSLRRGPAGRDDAVIRSGVLCFAAFSLWENTIGTYWLRVKVEPYGFAILLACLGYVAARKTMERDKALGDIQIELDLAKRIQLSLLPAEFPSSAHFRVAARYVPMTSVAGDLYDFLVADSSQAGLLIADVSGHGVPAALIASMVKMAAISQRPNAADPARLLAGMNAALCGNTQNEYVTAAYVHLDAQAGELRYAAAGHPPMLLMRNGVVTEIAENGMLLAALEDASFSSTSRRIEAGDRIVLYTDGILEARSSAGKMFGDEALHEAVRESAALAPAGAADRIVEQVRAWAKTQDDDLTLLVCDFLGGAQVAGA